MRQRHPAGLTGAALPPPDPTPVQIPNPDGAAGVSTRSLGVTGSVCLVLFVGVLVAVVTGASAGFDTTVHDTVVAVRTPTATALAATVTGLGSFPVLVGVAVLAAAGLWLRTRRIPAPSLMLLGLGTIACTVYLLKIGIGRPRPSTLTLIGSPSSDYSFPSGHTSNGTVTWLLAALLLTAGLRAAVRHVALAVGAVLGLGIGLSRVYLGHHWMTDVLAGWFLAAAAVCLIMIIGRLGLIPVRSETASEIEACGDRLDRPGRNPFASTPALGQHAGVAPAVGSWLG